MGLFAGIWSEAWELLPLLSTRGRPVFIALAALFLALLARPVFDVLRSRPRARFWLLGALAGLLPVAASFPHDRLLLAASIGGAGFLAELIDAALSSADEIRSRWMGPVLLAIHLIIAPAACVVRASSVDRLDELVARQQASLPSAPTVREQTLVLLNPPLDPFAAYVAPYREIHGIPRPRALYWLATGVSALTVTTLDAHTLLVSPESGFLDGSTQRMLRDPARSTRYTPVRLAQASFEVTRLTADGRPSELRVTFLRALSDPLLGIFRWSGTGYVPFIAPAPGASVTLPVADFASLL
jgi:hypothetical protein